MRVMETFTAVIQAFGGPDSYANAVGIKDFHARTMRQRDSIPPAYWSDTVRAAQELDIEGVTLETLARIAAAKRPTAEQGAA